MLDRIDTTIAGSLTTELVVIAAKAAIQCVIGCASTPTEFTDGLEMSRAGLAREIYV